MSDYGEEACFHTVKIYPVKSEDIELEIIDAIGQCCIPAFNKKKKVGTDLYLEVANADHIDRIREIESCDLFVENDIVLDFLQRTIEELQLDGDAEKSDDSGSLNASLIKSVSADSMIEDEMPSDKEEKNDSFIKEPRYDPPTPKEASVGAAKFVLPAGHLPKQPPAPVQQPLITEGDDDTGDDDFVKKYLSFDVLIRMFGFYLALVFLYTFWQSIPNPFK